MQILVNLLLGAIAVFASAYIIPGVSVGSFTTALVVAIILSAVNAFVKPIISLITLPINILTLGLFSFVISALMVLLTAKIVPGFDVDGFVVALVFGMVLSLISGALYTFMPDKKE